MMCEDWRSAIDDPEDWRTVALINSRFRSRCGDCLGWIEEDERVCFQVRGFDDNEEKRAVHTFCEG